jgi:hypothetical protein
MARCYKERIRSALLHSLCRQITATRYFPVDYKRNVAPGVAQIDNRDEAVVAVVTRVDPPEEGKQYEVRFKITVEPVNS